MSDTVVYRYRNPWVVSRIRQTVVKWGDPLSERMYGHFNCNDKIENELIYVDPITERLECSDYTGWLPASCEPDYGHLTGMPAVKRTNIAKTSNTYDLVTTPLLCLRRFWTERLRRRKECDQTTNCG